MKPKKLNKKEVEERLGKIIQKLNLTDKISVEWLKDFVYNFDLPVSQISQKYFDMLMDLLPKNIEEKEMMEAVKIFNDAWNIFPQKALGGKSPEEKLRENGGTPEIVKKEMIKKEKKMIADHYKYAEEHVDEYIDWAFKEVMPRYDKYVKNLKMDDEINVVGVAGIFLEICGQMGFFDINRFPPQFINDFPDIFTESVTGPKIKKEKVAEYLKIFLSFLEIYYGYSPIVLGLNF